MTTSHELALLQSLKDADPYGIPKRQLFAEVNIRLTRNRVITQGDFDSLLRTAESKKRVIAITGEDDVIVKITDDGKLRLVELNA